MQQEKPIWKILTIGVTLLGVVATLFVHFDTKHSTESDIVEALSERYASVDKDMSYEQALQALYKDSEQKGQVIEDLNNRLTGYEQSEENWENEKESLLNEINILQSQISTDKANSDIIDSAQSFADLGEYDKALALLNGIAIKTPPMEVLISQITKQYEEEIIVQVDSFINGEKFDEAVKLIDDALNVIPNSSLLLQKKENILNLKPQTLMNKLSPYEVNRYTEKTAGQSMLMGGDKYYNGFQLESYYPAYAVFNLNSQYTRITGIVGHVDSSGNDDAVINIFADGVLIKTIDIGHLELPQNLDIDVTGVKQLKFEKTSGDRCDVGFAELVIR